MNEGLWIKQRCAMPLRDDLARLNYMGIVFQPCKQEPAPKEGMGYYQGMVFDERACMFDHFNLDVSDDDAK